jgi:endonuclease/exonuclease/phosphatase family metal-dependent hydrolase
MRCMTYNVLDGGGERTELLLQVIASAAPDVLALQECNRFEVDGGALLRRFEAALGMRGFLAPSASGYHTALFARPALRWLAEHAQSEGMARAAAIATLELSGFRFAAVSLHLDPMSPAARVSEAQRVLAALPAGTPALIMGDLNALSASDLSRMQPSTWPERHRLRHGVDEHDVIDTRALDTLLAAGFVDLAAAHDRAPALTRPTQLYAHRDMPAQRLDYVLATADLARRVSSVRALDNPATQLASDHLPVITDLSISTA